MADGFRIEFDGDDAVRVEAAAGRLGISVEAYVRELVLSAAQDGADVAADRREIDRRWALFEASGETFAHEEVASILRRRASGEEPV